MIVSISVSALCNHQSNEAAVDRCLMVCVVTMCLSRVCRCLWLATLFLFASGIECSIYSLSCEECVAVICASENSLSCEECVAVMCASETRD